MFSKFLYKWNASISIRLAFLYTCIFASFIFIIFFAFYFLFKSHLTQENNTWLLEEAQELKQLIKTKISNKIIKDAMETEKMEKKVFIFYCLRDKKGHALVYSNPGYWKELLNKKYFSYKWNKKHTFETLKIEGHIFKRVYLSIYKSKVLEVTAFAEDDMQFVNSVFNVFYILCLAILPLFWCLGYFMIKNALKPIQVITEIAHKISEENFEERIPVRNAGDELDKLAITLNSMLGRINCLWVAVKEKNDNLAHNLRTPISRIRLDAEVTLLRERSLDEYKEVLQNCLAECGRLLEMLNTMLDIAEVEAGIKKWIKEEINIDELLFEIIDIFTEIAKYKNITIHSECNSGAFILGNYKQLRQAIVNILDNAVKYTPSGGNISVISSKKEKLLTIKVQDNGIGIDDKDLQRVFGRFYRGANSYSFTGNGLGLSFVKAVTGYHNADIKIESNKNKGTIVTICFTLDPNNK